MPSPLQRVTEVNATTFEDEDWRIQLNDYSRVFLAEGDSWFSYGSTKFRNVPSALRFPYKACVVNLAAPGDTLRRMHETTRNPDFFRYLQNRGGRRWSAILLSGGGNDLIDAVWNPRILSSEVLLQPARPSEIDQTNLRSVIDEGALAALFSYIKLNVEQIVVQGRDGSGSNSRDVPLFMHTYALIQPRNAPVSIIGTGPWLYPACVWLGIDASLWRDLSKLLLQGLADCLTSITLPNFHVIDTLNAVAPLIPAEEETTGDSNDWENEIHPDRGGYTKLAALWSPAIDETLAL